jgi:hypothetical protein
MVGEYKTLVVKMNDDSTSNVDARSNYELLCDVEIVMGFTCVMLMLEAMQSLNKLIQNKDIFIFYFVVAIKSCQIDIYTMYMDIEKQYSCEFQSFMDLVMFKNDSLCIQWWIKAQS